MYAGNVGAATRVAANFGVERLVLVDPDCVLEEPDFIRMAMGAERHVRIEAVRTIEAAIAGSDLVVATTSGRDRDPRWLGPPAEVRVRAEQAGASCVAVIFGPERKGLSREELRRAHLLLTIPSNPEFPVLNLAQAVGIVLAAFAGSSLALAEPTHPLEAPAPAEEFDAAMEHLRQVLLDTGFLDPVNPARVMDQIRLMLGRAVPTRREVTILRGLAAHINYLWRRP